MEKPKLFTTRVERFPGVGTWIYGTIPFDCEKYFGKKGRIRVKATINAREVKATLMPHGNAKHFIIFNKEIREKTGIGIGDRVAISLALDNDKKNPDVPEDFRLELKKTKIAFDFFTQLPPSRRLEYIKWINEAKKIETRQNRIALGVSKLKNQKVLK